jgi:hypothetical protein
MDAFSYLSVLLSIILGLAVTQVLQGYRGLLLARARVRLYAPTLIWSALMLVIAIQLWWASFGLADHREWTFVPFAVLLLQTILLYMMAAIILPDMPAGEAIDLRDHYYRERLPFFALSLAMLATSILKDRVIDGHLPGNENLAFHLVFAVLAVVAMLTPARRYHEWTAPLMILFILAYIGLLFARLQNG